MKISRQLIFNLPNKTDPDYEISIEFRLSDVKQEDEEDIGLAYFNENYKSKLMRKFFQKVTGWLFDDCGIVPNEKKD